MSTHVLSVPTTKPCVTRSGGGGLSFEDDGQGFPRPQPVAPTRRRRSWLTSGGGGTPSLSGERGGDSHAGTSGSVSEEGSEGAPQTAAPPPLKKRRRPGADATAAMALATRLPGQQLLRAAGPLTGSTAFDGITTADGVSQLPLDGDLLMPRTLATGLFPEAAGIGKRQASLSGWLPDRAHSVIVARFSSAVRAKMWCLLMLSAPHMRNPTL